MMLSYFLSYDEKKRLETIDYILKNGSPEFDRFVEAEEIVRRLKGAGITDAKTAGPMVQIIETHNSLITENYSLKNNIATMQSELYAVREDMKKLIRAVDTMTRIPYSSELQDLKSKNNIY